MKYFREMPKSVSKGTTPMLALCGAIVLLTFTGDCKSKSEQIKFILPNGLKGTFEIVIDPSNGDSLSREGDTFVFRIPASGVLRIKAAEPLESWHQDKFYYEDGTDVTSNEDAVSADVEAGQETFESSEHGQAWKNTLRGRTYRFLIK